MTFVEVIDTHMGLIIDRLNKTSIPNMEQEDLYQELITISHHAYLTYDKDRGKFSTHLYNLLTRHIGDLLRKCNTQKNIDKHTYKVLNRLNEGEEFLNTLSSYDDVIKNNIKIDLQREIKGIVTNNLTDKERIVVKYKYGKDYTYKEIATMEGVSIEAIDSRLRKALKKIREGMRYE